MTELLLRLLAVAAPGACEPAPAWPRDQAAAGGDASYETRRNAPATTSRMGPWPAPVSPSAASETQQSPRLHQESASPDVHQVLGRGDASDDTQRNAPAQSATTPGMGPRPAPVSPSAPSETQQSPPLLHELALSDAQQVLDIVLGRGTHAEPLCHTRSYDPEQIPTAHRVAKTSLMVRNISRDYTQEMLVRAWPLDGTYDFLHLPWDQRRAANMGFAFINFRCEALCLEFEAKWRGRSLPGAPARARLTIVPADVQGLEANLRQLKKRRVFRIVDCAWQPIILGPQQFQ